MGDDAPRPQVPRRSTPTRWSPARSRTACCWRAIRTSLLEGMILGALRHPGRRRLHLPALGLPRGRAAPARAIAEAHDAGYLGANILGSGFNLELHLHVSAGRYMCGEETGLLNALEGKRATPRAKPPYPAGRAACGASRRSSTTSRRSATCPHIVDHGRRVVPRPEPHRRRRHEALRRRAAGCRRPGAVGAAHGHHRRARSSRSTPAACATATPSRGCCPAGPPPTSWSTEHLDVPMDFELGAEGGQPPGHRHDDRPGRPDLPGGHGAQPRALLRPGVVRLVHALPRGPAVDGQACSTPSSAARASTGDLELLEQHCRLLGPGTPSARWRPARSSRCRAR